MTLRELVDRILQQAKDPVTGDGPSGPNVLDAVRNNLIMLQHKETWYWNVRHVDPLITTYTSQRWYDLPNDFPDNFLPAADNGRNYMVKLSDGSSEDFLTYNSPEKFLGLDFDSTSTGRPSEYTILSGDGAKKLGLHLLPDSNSSSHYTIRGAYRADFSRATLDSWIPPEPAEYILYQTLMLLRPENPFWQQAMLDARVTLYVNEARLRNTILAPDQGPDGTNAFEEEY